MKTFALTITTESGDPRPAPQPVISSEIPHLIALLSIGEKVTLRRVS